MSNYKVSRKDPALSNTTLKPRHDGAHVPWNEAPLIPDLEIRWRRFVGFTFRLFYLQLPPEKEPPVSMGYEAVWASEQV
jgi:hypothetical protein